MAADALGGAAWFDGKRFATVGSVRVAALEDVLSRGYTLEIRAFAGTFADDGAAVAGTALVLPVRVARNPLFANCLAIASAP